MTLCCPVLFKRLSIVFGIASLLVALSGCTTANGTHQITDSHPALALKKSQSFAQKGKFGTSVPIPPTLSLTAAHVGEFIESKVIARHPVCDVALIAADNRHHPLPDLGLVYQGDPVQVFGHASNGDVLTAEGLYYMDLMIRGFPEVEDCPSSITDAPVRGGMNGGGAFNAEQELVGILVGYAYPERTRLDSGQTLNLDRMTIFVAINYLRPWLEVNAARYGGLESPQWSAQGEGVLTGHP